MCLCVFVVVAVCVDEVKHPHTQLQEQNGTIETSERAQALWTPSVTLCISHFKEVAYRLSPKASPDAYSLTRNDLLDDGAITSLSNHFISLFTIQVK